MPCDDVRHDLANFPPLCVLRVGSGLTPPLGFVSLSLHRLAFMDFSALDHSFEDANLPPEIGSVFENAEGFKPSRQQ